MSKLFHSIKIDGYFRQKRIPEKNCVSATANRICILKSMSKFMLTEVTKPSLNLVISLIPRELWQLKMGFSDGL